MIRASPIRSYCLARRTVGRYLRPPRWPTRFRGVTRRGSVVRCAGKMADYTEILARTDFFADAPYDALERIAASGTERHLVRGDVLFSEGDPPEAIYLVLQGRIAIAIANELDRRESVVALMEAGDLFGELAMLDSGPRSAMARAIEPSHVLEVPFGPVLEMLRARPPPAVELHPAARPTSAGGRRGDRRLGVPRRHRSHRQASARARRTAPTSSSCR